ncbi:hypothetical protein P168DRAFT_287265 [Aspergillus campestris IBT 28561]|uniref:Uncharacterized protein n=1 Tax=Aspergillus campestris (strain IBT 28561) TaxID=1392248 RepID=A0A2I1DH50_ASPC2|nr:uncharacterized protein P168DRAFT_287265 [Aspergillus campestris IBT 28561]PKY09198.1 hypothetical protein P168DRAFT_287265 [Aspergillus campestris IBT 28561]
MPSRCSLSRFLNAFFDGFHPHFPLLHPITFQMQNCDPESSYWRWLQWALNIATSVAKRSCCSRLP